MHSLAMHGENRTAKGLVSPKISGSTSPTTIIRSQHLTAAHHPHHPHLMMPHATHPLHAHHASLHHQHPSPYSLGTSLSLTPTGSATSSPTSSLQNNTASKYDLTPSHHQLGQAAQQNAVVTSPSSGNSGQSSHHPASHHSQQANHHEYSHFGSPNVKSETPAVTSNYDYMSQCYFAGGSVPVSSAASGFAVSSAGAIPSSHGTADLTGYHHQHNVIQAAKLMASS